MGSNHYKAKRCEIDNLGGLRASHAHRNLRNIALTVTLCGNLVVFLSAQSQSTSPTITEDTNSAVENATMPRTGAITGTVVD